MSFSYTQTPFQPTNPYPNQVTTELNLANQNFTTLAQAFVNQNPTSLTVLNSISAGGYGVSATPTPNTLLPLNANAQFPINVLPPGVGNGYANPVNLSSATADYMLQPGQVAYVSFSSQTVVPLNIATTNGTYYEMDVVLSNSVGTSGGTGSMIALNPNNTTYSNMFVWLGLFQMTGSTSPSGYSQTFSTFRVGYAVADFKVFITNFTTHKSTKEIEFQTELSDAPVIVVEGVQWNDTTTSWTSLGTVTFPQTSSGYILVRRLL